MMKTLLIILSAAFATSTYASPDGDRIAMAIQSGNTTELAAMFNTSIELVTPGSSGISTRDQARIVLDNFFKNNPPVKASIAHETTGTTNSMIVISLVTKTGTFRISITGSTKGGSFLINEFKIS